MQTFSASIVLKKVEQNTMNKMFSSQPRNSISEEGIIIFSKTVVFLGWVFLIFFIAISSIPTNPITPPKKITMGVRTIIPQGWSFFTKSPKDPSPIIYKKNTSTWKKINYKNFSYKNLFGFSRSSRAMLVELGSLINRIPKEKWKEFPLPIENSISDKFIRNAEFPFFSVENSSPNPRFCGYILATEKKYVPWSWSSNSDDLEMPAKSIIVNVKCD